MEAAVACAVVVFFLFFATTSRAYPVLLPDDEETILVVGQNTIFRCYDDDPDENNYNIRWFFNDTAYEDGNWNNVIAMPNPNSPFVSEKLQFTNISREFNDTAIFCTIIYETGEYRNTTSTRILLQGLLLNVENLSIAFFDRNLCLNWSAPFSLDLPDNDIDIKYKIIVSSSLGILLNCIVNMTKFNATIEGVPATYDWCNSYDISVTPFNAVGCGLAVNETKSSLDDKEAVNFEVVSAQYLGPNSIQYSLRMVPPVCRVNVSIHDIVTPDVNDKLPDENIHISGNESDSTIINISTMNTTIVENRKYIATYHLMNSARTAMTNGTISTYDVQSISINSDAGEGILSVQFLEDSKAAGALLLFLSKDEESMPPILNALNREKSKHYIIPRGIGEREVVAFDIEANGELPEGMNYPATEKMYVSKNSYTQAFNLRRYSRCKSSSNGMNVTVMCECEQVSSSIYGYQVVLLQDKNSNGIILAFRGNCSGSVTTDALSVGKYHVIMFILKRDSGITESDMLYAGTLQIGSSANHLNLIIGMLIGIIFIILTIFLAVATYLCIYKPIVTMKNIRHSYFVT